MSGAIDFDGINAAALRSARSFLSGLIPGGKFRSLEYLVRNPRRDDREPGSFSINYKTGKWGDFATKDRGGDLISLVAHLRNCSQGEAARWLADKLGVPAFKSKGVVSRPNGSTVTATAQRYLLHQRSFHRETTNRRDRVMRFAGTATTTAMASPYGSRSIRR